MPEGGKRDFELAHSFKNLGTAIIYP